MKDPKDTPVAPTPTDAPRRLPYTRPAVISEEVFETLALSCASARIACPPSNPDRA